MHEGADTTPIAIIAAVTGWLAAIAVDGVVAKRAPVTAEGSAGS